MKIKNNHNILIYGLLLCTVFCCGFTNLSKLLEIESAVIEENYEKALKITQEYINNNPPQDQLKEAFYYLGLCQVRLGYFKKARETFNHLLSFAPDRNLEDKIYLALVESFYRQEQYPQALEMVNKLLARSFRSNFTSAVLLKKARIHLKLSQWQKAENSLEKLISKFPHTMEAHIAKQLLNEERYFSVQVGAFSEKERAEKLVFKLTQKNEYAYIVETFNAEGKKFYRVRIGKSSSLDDARRTQIKLSKLGYPAKIYP